VCRVGNWGLAATTNCGKQELPPTELGSVVQLGQEVNPVESDRCGFGSHYTGLVDLCALRSKHAFFKYEETFVKYTYI